MDASDPPLSPEERARVERLQAKARRLYDGVEVAHRSCGIAMAETFGCPTAAYQALRRGGLTGCGPCGVVLGARMVLGEKLGDPDPAGAPTEALVDGIRTLDAALSDRVRHATCNALTAELGDFRGPARHAHCTDLTETVAGRVAEILLRNGALGDDR